MEKNGCSFRKMSRDSSETSVNVFKDKNKTSSPKRRGDHTLHSTHHHIN